MKGKGIPLAERAMPDRVRKSGLRYLQQGVLNQRNAVLGNPRNFADAVND